MSSNLVVSYTPGADRNNFSGFIGMQFTLTGGLDLSVNSLGLRMATGNSGNHTVYLLSNADAVLASANVSLTGGSVGTFYYTGIIPVSITAAGTYKITTNVTSGGQNWSDQGPVTLAQAGSSVAIFSGTNSGFGINNSNQMYAGVDMSWVTPNTPQLPYWNNRPFSNLLSYTDPLLSDDIEVWYRNSIIQQRKSLQTEWITPNISIRKMIYYDVVLPPDKSVSIQKMIYYDVLSPPDKSVSIQKIISYAVLEPKSNSISIGKLLHHVVIESPPPLPARRTASKFSNFFQKRPSIRNRKGLIIPSGKRIYVFMIT